MTLMRMRAFAVALLAGLVLGAMLAGCTVERNDESPADSTDAVTESGSGAESDGDAEEPTPTGDVVDFPVTVTRTDGVDLEIEEPPQRIVSLSPGATETLFAIGAGEQVAAVDMFSDYPEEASELPQVDAYQPDPEEIISLEPDLVYTVFNPEGIVEILENAGIQVLYLDAPRSLDGMLEQIRTLGDITDNSDQAAELAGSLQERIDVVVAQAEEVDSTPTVYHELDAQLFTVGPNSFIGTFTTCSAPGTSRMVPRETTRSSPRR